VGHFLLVCLAGAAGTGARFALASGVTALVGTRLPYGTILVNLLGSFAIGVVMQLAAANELVSPATRTVLTTGFLGGFTTYSAFNHDTVVYLQQDLWGRALANVAITLVGCLAAGFAGVAAARRFAA
jgi:CrcB protein